MQINGKEMSLQEFERAEGLTVRGHLNLTRSMVERIPNGLCVYLDGCRNLREIGNIQVSGNILAAECDNLQFTGALKVGGNLDFRGCKQLKGIFDGLEVEGDFIAWGCQNLQYLPQGTRIEGEASLRGCFGLKNLPDNMRVGYKIWR